MSSLEIYPGAFAGIRLFRHRYGNELIAWGIRDDYVWHTDKTNRASCLRYRDGEPLHKEQAPVRGCTCGFWFFKNLEMLKEELEIGGTHSSAKSVMSLCAGWGKYVEHERGFRTEFGRPLCLIDPTPTVSKVFSAQLLHGEPLMRLAKALGIPVITATQIPQVAAEYGLDTLDPEFKYLAQWFDYEPVPKVIFGVNYPPPTTTAVRLPYPTEVRDYRLHMEHFVPLYAEEAFSEHSLEDIKPAFPVLEKKYVRWRIKGHEDNYIIWHLRYEPLYFVVLGDRRKSYALHDTVANASPRPHITRQALARFKVRYVSF